LSGNSSGVISTAAAPARSSGVVGFLSSASKVQHRLNARTTVPNTRSMVFSELWLQQRDELRSLSWTSQSGTASERQGHGKGGWGSNFRPCKPSAGKAELAA